MALIGRKIGGNIKRLREAKDLSQQTMAEALNVTPMTVSRWETGTFRPRLSNIKQIALFLGVTPLEIVEGSDPKHEGLTLAVDVLTQMLALKPNHLNCVLAVLFRNPKLVEDPEIALIIAKILKRV